MLRAAVLQRCLPSLVAVVVYAVFILLWHINRDAYQALQNASDFINDPLPYRDLSSVLLANVCAQQGVNVYIANPCMHGREYNYSPFLLHIWPGLGPGMGVKLGLVFAALFLLSATLLPPARNWVALREIIRWFVVVRLTSIAIAYLHAAGVELLAGTATLLRPIIHES